MSRLPLTNTDLSSVLASYAAAPGLVAGLKSALGAGPAEELTPSAFPVNGFFLQASATQLIAYFLTPGRFIRYEVLNGQSLTVTVPLTRIRRVVEQVSGANSLALTVELDADVTVGVTETESLTRPEPDSADVAGRARAVTRTSPTVYELAVTVGSEDGQTATADDLAKLADFSRALRRATGA